MKTVRNARPGRPKDESLWASRTDEILDTAATIFARHGYQGTEMQIIADAIEVGKGTIYRYFPSKQELFLKAVSRGMDRLRQAVRSAYEPIEDPLERMTVAIHAYLTFFRNHPQYVELLIQERAQFRDRKKQTYFEHREKNVGEWRQMYADLIADGRLRDVPVARILDAVSDLVYGTMFTNYFTGRHKPLEAQAKDLVDVLFFGILSDRERAAQQAAAGEITTAAHDGRNGDAIEGETLARGKRTP
jgi:AcrR family transcriptional regulator